MIRGRRDPNVLHKQIDKSAPALLCTISGFTTDKIERKCFIALITARASLSFDGKSQAITREYPVSTSRLYKLDVAGAAIVISKPSSFSDVSEAMYVSCPPPLWVEVRNKDFH